MRKTAGEQEAWIADRLGVICSLNIRDKYALFDFTLNNRRIKRIK